MTSGRMRTILSSLQEETSFFGPSPLLVVNGEGGILKVYRLYPLLSDSLSPERAPIAKTTVRPLADNSTNVPSDLNVPK